MNNKLLNEFNRDLQHGFINCLFEEFELFNTMKNDGQIDEEGPFGDIEVDILDFLKIQPYYKYVDTIGRRFEYIYIDDHHFQYEMSCNMDLHEGLIKYDWEGLEDEDDEPEEIFVDIRDVYISIQAIYLNYKLNKIKCNIFYRDENYEYELWPSNEIPDSFGGRFGEIDD